VQLQVLVPLQVFVALQLQLPFWLSSRRDLLLLLLLFSLLLLPLFFLFVIPEGGLLLYLPLPQPNPTLQSLGHAPHH